MIGDTLTGIPKAIIGAIYREILEEIYEGIPAEFFGIIRSGIPGEFMETFFGNFSWNSSAGVPPEIYSRIALGFSPEIPSPLKLVQGFFYDSFRVFFNEFLLLFKIE